MSRDSVEAYHDGDTYEAGGLAAILKTTWLPAWAV